MINLDGFGDKIFLSLLNSFVCFSSFLFKDYSLEKRKGRERGREISCARETSMGCLSQAPNPPKGDLAGNPGVCPDLGNPTGKVLDEAQSTEPYQSRLSFFFQLHS